MNWSLRSLARSLLRAPAARPRPQRLGVCRLEDRDVPAVFYVDPNATAGSTTFNQGQPGQVNGLTFGATLFTTFDQGVMAAEANPGADTLMLAVSTGAANGGFIDLDNTASATTSLGITQNLDVIGSGAGATVLSQLGDSTVPVIRVQGAGVVVNFSNLSFSGGATGFDGVGNVAAGNQTAVFLSYTAGSAGTITQAVFQGIYQNAFQGAGVAASGAGTSVTVQNSRFASVGRIGVSADAGATANVFGNTYLGKGAGPFQDYFVQVTNGASAVVSGNTASGNLGSTGGAVSAAVFLSAGGGAAATAQVFGNEFSGNTVGVLVGGGATDTSTADIQYNNIFGNSLGVATNRVAGSPALNAPNNFWGSSTGPFNATTNPGGLGNTVADNVTFVPFRTASAPVLAAPTLAAYLAAAFPPPVIPPVTPPVVPPVTPPVTPPVIVPPVTPSSVANLVVGTVPGLVTLVNSITGAKSTFSAPFGAIGSNAAVADFEGDGSPEIVLVPAAGGGPLVYVMSGTTGVVGRVFLAFDANFRGGLSVAVGDVTGDRIPDVVVGIGSNGGSVVRVFDGATFNQVASFFAFDPSYLGGVNVAVGDVNGDGVGDVIAATAGPGAVSQVKVVDGTKIGQTDARGVIAASAVVAAFTPYAGFTGGLFVAAGNFDGDAFADVAVTPAGGGGPVYTTFAGSNLATGNLSGGVTRPILPTGDFRGGFSVQVADVDGNGTVDVVVAAGVGGGPVVFGFDPVTGRQTLATFVFDPNARNGA